MGYLHEHQAQGPDQTPQSQPMPRRADMRRNEAGGYGWQVDDWTRLHRFLILGNETASCYQTREAMTEESVQCIHRLIASDQLAGKRIVETIVDVATNGRAAKKEPALFALALVAKYHIDSNAYRGLRRYALSVLPVVATTPTQLFAFIQYAEGQTKSVRPQPDAKPRTVRVTPRGWGPMLRAAIAEWYNGMSDTTLAYRMIKYRSRTVEGSGNSWSHADLLRLAHIKPVDSEHDLLYHWATAGGEDLAQMTWTEAQDRYRPIASGEQSYPANRGGVQRAVMARFSTADRSPFHMIWAYERANEHMEFTAATDPQASATDMISGAAATTTTTRYTRTPQEIVDLIRSPGLPREAIPNFFIGGSPQNALVWDALLDQMLQDNLMEALIRNLPTITRTALIAPLSNWTRIVSEAIVDPQRLRKARIHPIRVLTALMTYAVGRSARGDATWTPVPAIVDALNAAFYGTFPNVAPANKRFLLGIDVSASMGSGEVAGSPGLSPRMAAAAMAMVTAATEPETHAHAFDTRPYEISLSAGALIDVMGRMAQWQGGGTNISQIVKVAQERNYPVECFVAYTDNQSWAGTEHVVQALRAYREQTGLPSRLIACSLINNSRTVADPNDGGMLDVVGFDTDTPQIMTAFARGEI